MTRAERIEKAAREIEEVARDAHEDGCEQEEWRVRQALSKALSIVRALRAALSAPRGEGP